MYWIKSFLYTLFKGYIIKYENGNWVVKRVSYKQAISGRFRQFNKKQANKLLNKIITEDK